MRDSPRSALLNRFFLLTILICALNLAARPHQVSQVWSNIQNVYQTRPFSQANVEVLYKRMTFLAQAMPWRDDLWRAAGNYALWAGAWQSGLDSFSRINFTGLDAEQWMAVGDAYNQLEQFDRAEASWQSSFALEQNAAVYQRIYDLHRQNDDDEAILADLQELTRLEPENSPLAYQFAIHLAASVPQQALDYLKQRPEFEEPYQAKMELLEQKLLSATLSDSSAVQILISGQGLAELKEWDLAVLAFRQSIQLEPGYAEGWAFLGEAYQQLDPPQTENALKSLRTALSLDPKSISTITMLALYWQRQGEFQRAAGLFRTAASLQPDNPAWWAALGSLASVQGNLSDAETYFAAAVDLSPQQSTYYNLLANFYIQNQIQIEEKALPAAIRAVEISPTDPESLSTLAQVYLLLDDGDKAVQILQSTVSLNPNFAKGHYLLGMAYIFRNQPDLAYAHLVKARDTAQDSAILEQVQRAVSYYFP